VSGCGAQKNIVWSNVSIQNHQKRLTIMFKGRGIINYAASSLTEFEVASERASLVRNPLHHAAVAAHCHDLAVSASVRECVGVGITKCTIEYVVGKC
jgi:hypothetical protein